MTDYKIQYDGVDLEFTREELKTIAFLETQKPIIKKITNKLVNKLIIQLLNKDKEISADYIRGYEKAVITFLSNFKI